MVSRKKRSKVLEKESLEGFFFSCTENDEYGCILFEFLEGFLQDGSILKTKEFVLFPTTVNPQQ